MAVLGNEASMGLGADIRADNIRSIYSSSLPFSRYFFFRLFWIMIYLLININRRPRPLRRNIRNMDAPNELLHVQILGIRWEQKAPWGRSVHKLISLPEIIIDIGIIVGPDAPMWKLAAAGSMGASHHLMWRCRRWRDLWIVFPCVAGGIAGLIGNPGGA